MNAKNGHKNVRQVQTLAAGDDQLGGTLYVVATPIGNLDDFSKRAIDVLRDEVAIIACEDTRHSRILLQHYAINTETISLHAHNEVARSEKLIARLEQGESIALISDAGTPLISDPGAALVAMAHQRQIPVSPIAGPCAAIAALSASGVSADKFTFIGFLASKGARRFKQLQAWLSYPTTLIFYESPYRVVDFFKLCLEIEKIPRRYCLAREISKRYETITQGSCEELLNMLEQNPHQVKGEYVVIVEAFAANKNAKKDEAEDEKDDAISYKDPDDNLNTNDILKILMQQLTSKQSIDLCSKITGVKKNTVYDLALKLKKES